MEHKLRVYMALLTLNENNFRVLHWKLCNKGFQTAHVRFGGYYDQLGDYMDETAEQMISMGMTPVNMSDALGVVRESEDVHGIIMSAEQSYDVKTADIAAKNMFDQLYSLAASLADEDDLPIDVQDVFTGHARYFRIEGSYKLGRSLAEPSAVQPNPMENHEDDDD
jgi:hypothetical protein